MSDARPPALPLLTPAASPRDSGIADSPQRAKPSDLRKLLEEAVGGQEAALDALRHQFAPAVLLLCAEGERRYGDLGIPKERCARALARVVVANLDAEAAWGDAARARIEAVVPGLVLSDVYLSEALLAGSVSAWRQFEEILDAAFRSVRSYYSGKTSRDLLKEIRESLLGTFFLDGKIATYRATAPIGAWARQVMFNLFRQRVNQRKTRRDATLLSQIGREGLDGEGLLPPSREPPPPDILDRAEWSSAFAQAVPQALASLDVDERHMLEVLPSKRVTQVQLAKEMGISPFKLNRWYKEVRQRFLREVTHRLRLLTDLDDLKADRLVAYLSALWSGSPEGESAQDQTSA